MQPVVLHMLANAAAGAPRGARKARQGSRVRQAGHSRPRRVSTRTAFCLLRPEPGLSNTPAVAFRPPVPATRKAPCLPESSGRAGRLASGVPGRFSAVRAYTGPPPMELPKSRSEPLNHVLVGDDAGTPATGAHEPATPRSICKGAGVRFWVAKEWACIVVSSVVRFRMVRSAPRGGKQKEPRSSRPSCEGPANPDPWS